MPTFRYSAFKPTGGETTGVIEADNPREAKERLKKNGLFAREILPAEDVAAKSVLASLRKRVSLPDLALMTRRLATLLGSSVPVFEAITTLYQQERGGELKNVLGRIRERLAEGANLAKAMAAERE